jgi:simple sugar transport system ATP-binding protein
METILELRGITKRFPGVLANDQIDLSLIKGQIHALLGENGAGKSTLMNILYGLYQPDEGEIYYGGKKLEVYSPIDSINAGIGMVHQHFMLVPVFTVTENVMLGDEDLRGGVFLDRAKASERVREISEQYNLEVDPDMEIRDLPVGIQQRVEIIKLLYREADVLILDEPTAVLTPQEVEGLFRVMRNLIDKGKSIIFITHKLKEVLAIADHFTVLRRGKVVGSATPATFDEKDLASMMVGRDVLLDVQRKPAETHEKVLSVSNLSVIDDRSQLAVDNVSFDVQAGEILGLAGVQGNGQTELVEALTGLRSVLEGSITIEDQPATNLKPRTVTEMGISHVPEDRQSDGLVLTYSLIDNLALQTYYQAPFSDRGVMQQETMKESAERLIASFDIRTPDAETTVGSLSGGNQQKVIVAREFDRDTNLVIASQPTRGLDVGSIEYIHKRLVEKRDAGAAVLLVSTELDEVLQLADRIAVMYRGKIIDILSGDEANKEQLGLLMAGITQEKTQPV